MRWATSFIAARGAPDSVLTCRIGVRIKCLTLSTQRVARLCIYLPFGTTNDITRLVNSGRGHVQFWKVIVVLATVGALAA